MSKRKNVGVNRRQFLGGAAAALGAGVWIGGTQAWADTEQPNRRKLSPSDKLNVAFIAVAGPYGKHPAGRAAGNIEGIDSCHNAQIVGLCDVDEPRIGPAKEAHPKAQTFTDYRVMLDKMKEIDAVVVSTPDHTHAVATMAAMQLGKNVYCEKPLTHCLYEARKIRETADKLGTVTQLGTQIHAEPNYRRVVEIIQSGAIGAVKEVHVFCGKSWGTTKRVEGEEPVPKGLDYDLWIGPVTPVPYNHAYIPENWRSYWHFGSGSLGDMGCHYIDLAFWALDLRFPTRVEAKSPTKYDPEDCPPQLEAHWEFPARGDKPPVKLSWYDGGLKPAVFHEYKVPWSYAVLFIGEKGALVADYERHRFVQAEKFKDFTPPPQTIPKSVGHHQEWVNACIANDPKAPLCRFDYGGPLSETVLLGCLAFKVGKPLEWDAENLKATNAPEAEEFIKLPYREGWSL